MSAPTPGGQDKVTDWVRKQANAPTTSLFRVMNFELSKKPSLNVAVPGTLLFIGTLAYFAAMKAQAPPRQVEQHDDDD